MKNVEVCAAFVNGEFGQSNSMRTDGNRLWSYNTVIAQKTPKGILFNTCKYSVTTSKQQTYARCAMDKADVAYIEVTGDIWQGTQDLKPFLKKKKAA